MKIRRNDDNGDWLFGYSDATYCIDNAIGVAQKVKTRLLEWVDDCFFNRSAGINYRVRMGQRGQRAALDDDIKRIITETEEVVALVEYNSSLYDRDLRVDFSVYHIYSDQLYSDSITLQGVQYV